MNHLYEVFIFCSGKSGSMSLYDAFCRAGYKTLHIHHPRQFMKRFPGASIDLILEKSSEVYKNIYIIDVYRNPIERKLSSFFFHLDTHLNGVKMSFGEIECLFNESYLNYLEEYHSIRIVQRLLNLKRFESFNCIDKINIMKKDNLHLIKLRFKDILLWADIIQSTLRLDISIRHINSQNSLPHNSLYEKAKSEFSINGSYLKRLVYDNEFNIYNNCHEAEDYISFWRAKIRN